MRGKDAMSLLTIFLSALFFTALGTAYVKGYDFVKAKSPERMPQFYLIMAAIRMILVITVVAIYVVLLSQNRQDSISFAVMFLGMYAAMMVITLILKH